MDKETRGLSPAQWNYSLSDIRTHPTLILSNEKAKLTHMYSCIVNEPRTTIYGKASQVIIKAGPFKRNVPLREFIARFTRKTSICFNGR